VIVGHLREEGTMRPRIDGPATIAPHFAPPAAGDALRDGPALAELFVGVFRRDVLGFFPRASLEPLSGGVEPVPRLGGPIFRLVEPPEDDRGVEAVEVELFGDRYRLAARDGSRLSAQDRRMVAAIGAVLGMRYYHLFQVSGTPRLELYRGGSEDHYVAAFVEPSVYAPPGLRPSRVAATVQTLRTAALSTYENHRVSTGAMLLGPEAESDRPARPSPPDALPFGVELTALKSIHRLCDGQRTLFLVDRAGRLAEIVDIARWADEPGESEPTEVPGPREYEPHARATARGGHICLVLSPNQEIKVFAGGLQAFAFAHGRWRILDPAAKYAVWRRSVGEPGLARALFAAALNMAEERRGGLFVVVGDPARAVGRLIARHDLLTDEPPPGPPPELTPRDPLARRALHYLARGRQVTELDPAVLEALASLDGALATDRDGRLLAFGAILRQDGAGDLPGLALVEGARTSAALVASLYGPVLKVSEDGIVSCFLDGARAWDL
jgi:hypothetical protein